MTVPTRLVCTLGTSWAVVAEALAFLDPGRLPFFKPADTTLDGEPRRGFCKPDEIWVITTEGMSDQLRLLAEWHRGACPDLPIRAWRTAGVTDLISEKAIAHMRELIHRVVLHATAEAEAILCLTGGRKTMSADLQAAGGVFGAVALVHVVQVSNEKLPPAKPSDLLPNTQAPWLEQILPVRTGRGRRSDLLDVAWQERKPVTPDLFQLPPADRLDGKGGGEFGWSPGEASLVQEVAAREEAGGRVTANFLRRVAEEEKLEGWRSLYHLGPREIEYLRRTYVTAEHEPLFKELPKADLHRHLGGTLDLPAQRRVAQCVWCALTSAERTAALERVRPLLASDPWAEDWPESLGKGRRGLESGRSHCVAALLVNADDECLSKNLFRVQPRRGLHARVGFPAYERPGELMGSAILGHPAAVKPYAREAYAQARREGLAYVELRGSPFKYLEGGPSGARRFLAMFREGIEGAENDDPGCLTRFIVSTERRLAASAADIVDLAADAWENQQDPFVVAVDVAGDETRAEGDPKTLAPFFNRAFEVCLPLTIHAGETAPAASIWQAAYLLHADRIGHGLTLVDHRDLASRFRNRGICLEMCPSSNLEVVGFREPGQPDGAPYPLRSLMDLGLPIALCTDNPFISRTTLGHEFVVASDLDRAGGGPGLSLWEALSILREAFARAFLPASPRGDLMRDVDVRVFDVVDRWLKRVLIR